MKTVLTPAARGSQVPETKGLTLEEMDSVFGSEGLAAADAERQLAIEKRLGLDQYAFVTPDSESTEKAEIHMNAKV